MFPKSKVLSLFDARFDYASARIVLGDAMARAGVSAAKEGLDGVDLRRLADALTALGLPRVEALAAGLIDLAGAGPAGKAKAAPEPEPEAEAAPAEEAEEPAEAEAEAEAPKGKPQAKGKKR